MRGRAQVSWRVPPWLRSVPRCAKFVKAGLVGGLVLVGGAEAQPPRSCQERLAEFRVYADLVTAGRTRSEVEAAQGIAALRRDNDTLRAEIRRLTEALESARGQNSGK